MAIIGRHCLRRLLLGLTLVGVNAQAATGRTASVAQATRLTLADSPVASVGGADERIEYQLQHPVGAVRLSDGRLVVADAGSRSIRYFDRDGRHLKTTGRSGGGPGEFRNLRSISRIRGDTVIAWDAVQRRASYYDPQGNLVGTVMLEGWARVVREWRGPPLSLHAVHWTSNGQAVVEAWPERDPRRFDSSVVIQDTVPVLSFDRTGQNAVSLGRFPSPEFFFHGRMGALLVHGDRLLVAATDDIVWIGSSRSGDFSGISTAGNRVGAVRAPFLRRASVRQERSSSAGRIADYYKAMPMPDSMPRVSAIRAGAEGRLWMQRYQAPGDALQEWVALRRNGTVELAFSVPGDMEVLDIGPEFVVVLTRDEFDLATIQVYRLTR
jgi:hypothetical protein